MVRSRRNIRPSSQTSGLGRGGAPARQVGGLRDPPLVGLEAVDQGVEVGRAAGGAQIGDHLGDRVVSIREEERDAPRLIQGRLSGPGT
jgi:hypothetical protein